ELWKKQISEIRRSHGLISFIVHPDYVSEPKAQKIYHMLLGHVDHLRSNQKIWTPLPHEVDRWWRNRSRMTLERNGENWKISGEGSDRARVAHAVLDGDRLQFELNV